jgi:uncharacterized protein
MITAMDGLVDELRRVGIPVSVAEKVDAAHVLRHVALEDRDAVKAALRCVLVKDEEHEPAYDAIFDIYFAPVLPRDGGDDRPAGPVTGGADGGADGGQDGTAARPGGTGGQGAGGLGSLDDAAIRRLLLQALDAEQWTLVRTVAGVLVDRHAGIQPGRAVAGTYYLFRTLRAVDPDQLLATLVERAASEDNLDGLTRRLVTEQYERRVRRFQQEVEAQIRRRLVADRGAEAVARTLRKPLPEDVDFLTASAQQIAELREVLAPMARRLTARLAAKRRHHHRRGALDFRRTVRASMSTGAVPVTPVFRKPRPSKPELFILADISGSVSTFAAFTLQLTYALRAQFSKVRSFVFVDGVDEVTGILAEADNIVQATSRINAEGRGVWLDGRSDYGNALETFWERYGGQLRRRTAVLLLGDARTNYHASGATVVKRMAQQAGDVFWLNPEPATVWDSGDSVMREYAAYCDAVFECRNIRQLRSFIEHLA